MSPVWKAWVRDAARLPIRGRLSSGEWLHQEMHEELAFEDAQWAVERFRRLEERLQGNRPPLGPFGDCDNSPSKDFILAHRDDLEFSKFFELAFAKRPDEELYDLGKNPIQLT